MIEQWLTECRQELYEIADWWADNTLDEQHGGFIGEMSALGEVNFQAEKGVILNSRILWFFSELAVFTDREKYRSYADRAYNYFVGHFFDDKNGGVYWKLSAEGEMLVDRKQVYAQAFAIYGLVAYYKLSAETQALEKALALFDCIENKAFDTVHGGYLEAFNSQWQPLDDMRLSDKDLNAPKTMNTHLHILEAYTSLYSVVGTEKVASALRHCIRVFDERFINRDTWHLRMFQSRDWVDISDSVSYGHDIEFSWLLWEALHVLGDIDLQEKYAPVVKSMAATVLAQGLGEQGEVFDAYNFKTGELLKERVWWVQAEALVGFLNAYQLSDDTRFLNAFENNWQFVKQYQKDQQAGEWHWLSTLDLPELGDCKMGFWKAPYHNGRAMMEVCKLLARLT